MGTKQMSEALLSLREERWFSFHSNTSHLLIIMHNIIPSISICTSAILETKTKHEEMLMSVQTELKLCQRVVEERNMRKEK